MIAASCASLGLAFAQTPVDASKSTVQAVSKQMNVAVTGTFKKFSAQMAFDPAKPDSSSATLTIETGSYDLGDETYNKEVRGKTWFDSAAYPNATFVSSSIAPDGAQRFKVTGTLTIKGKSQNITLPVSVSTQGTTQVFDGQLPIRRSQYDVGTGEWKDTSVVADEVVIKFHIVTNRG